MHKSLTLILALLISTPIIAQINHSHSHQVALGGGQEWNAFLRPSTFSQDGEFLNKEELWDHGTFQSLSFNNSFRWEKDQHRFKLKLNGSLGIFQTEENANRHSYTIGGSYRVKYAPKKYFEFSPEYLRKKREGINGDQAILATPFSFQQFRAPVSFDFYLGEGAWVKTEVGYLIKSYDRPDEQVLRYQAPFLGVALSKKWTIGEHTTKLTLHSVSQRRNYTDIDRITEQIDPEDEEDDFLEEDEEFEEEDEFRESERNWSYYFNNLTYSLKTADKKVRAEIGIYSTLRKDARNVSDYLEIGPGINATLKTGKWELSPSVRYSIRKYSRLAPGNGNNLLLQYKYLRVRFKSNYRLTNNVSFFGRYILTNRDSNNPTRDSNAFREYFYAQGELGVRWKL
ncbi:MAG: hypothetical protein R8G66_01470 [Cytophagales bacterium]|nr:hypothetical protein [Cytophagales bacterium]